MRGKLIFSPFDEGLDFFQADIQLGLEPYDYEVHIRTPLEEDFESIISKPYDFEESINLSLEVVAGEPNYVEFFQNFRNNRLELIKNAEYLMFEYEPQQIAEFVKKNPILSTKKIIFKDYYELNSKFANEISEAFDKNISNIYFQIPGNEDLITFKEYKDTIDAISQRIGEIDKYNFSPLEKIMYVYDIVRDKVYVEVDENEDKMISRNLSSALLGDKIVCIGYARIFQTLLEKLGIECKQVLLKQPGKKAGHARNVIYIKDEKYGVNGVYYFDPTWDSKKNEFDTGFLYSYKYFAMTKKRIDEIDDGELIDTSFPYFSNDIVEKFKEEVEEKGLEGLSDEMIKSINRMSHLISGKTLVDKNLMHPLVPPTLKPNKGDVLEKLTEVVQYFDTPLSADTLFEVLYNVRKQQYYFNPEKYPFGSYDFCKTVFTSGWDFDGSLLENLAMQKATTPIERGKIKINQTVRYMNENDINKDIHRVKLAKTLRLVYEQKSVKQ